MQLEAGRIVAELDPEYLRMVSKVISDIYGDATSQMIRLVASRLAKGLDVDDSWATRKLLELVDLRAQITEVIEQLDGKVATSVAEVMDTAARKGAKVAASELAVTGSPLSATATGAVEALARETVDRLTGTHTQILRSTLDVYRTVVSEVSAPGVVTGTVTRRQAAQRAVDRWARQGVTGFVDRAGRNWEIESYAEMTTRTAGGRAMMEGSIDQYQSEGRNFVIVSDSPEECKQCRPFEGKGLSLDGSGIGTKVGGILIVDTLRGATSEGLFHVNCFPGDVAVSGPAVRAADARWYEGELVVIHTASGNDLPVTPNHPILTSEGWIAAGSLNVGDHLVRHHDTERMHLVGPDDQQVPTLIGDVARALRESGPTESMRMPATSEQFHGDGCGSYVDVVLADGLLGDRLDPPVRQPCDHHSFLVGAVGLDAFSGESSGEQIFVGANHSADSLMGSGDLVSSLLGGHLRPLAALGLRPRNLGATLVDPVPDSRLRSVEGFGQIPLGLSGLIPGDDLLDFVTGQPSQPCSQPEVFHPGSDDLVADVEGGRYLFDRLTEFVSLDDVVRIDRSSWSGHVYNLETVDGWYSANGIVVHNCRHRVSPIIPGRTKPMTHTADPEGDRDRQRQRALERRIRAAKRQVEAAAPFGSTPELARAKQLVANAQADMRQFIADTGRKRLTAREQIGRAR